MTDSNFDALRIQARAKIDMGMLPATMPSGVIGDYVVEDTRCRLCGQFIKMREFRYVVRAHSKVMGDQHYNLHFLCHAAWQLEVSVMMHDPPLQNNTATTFAGPQQPPDVNSSFVVQMPLTLMTPWSQQLLAKARELVTLGQHQFAVVLVHAACEWTTEEVINNLMRHSAPILDDAIQSLLGHTISLGDHKVRKVYGALTNDYPWHNPGGAPWWKDWDTTRELRNDVAHNGSPVTLEEANRALSSADAYIKHVASAVLNALK